MDDDGRYAEIQSRVRLRVLHDGVLLSALRWAAQDDGSDREIRTAIQSTCATAREAGVTAEQLLIVLKECWRKLPEAQRLLRRDADETRARLVTMCIDEYYAPDGAK
jgi:hypothetical protein